MTKQSDDRMTALYVSQKELRTAVALMERSLEAERAAALSRAGGLFPIDSGDAAAVTELEQILKRFRSHISGGDGNT